ncbi:hypothetical protein BDZ91DRAFT_800029 [Kalaharituber pfeilii]|nr:hypothetical protein BDZ91DRAFT_800029 [Kalaharituber pfeilii]
MPVQKTVMEAGGVKTETVAGMGKNWWTESVMGCILVLGRRRNRRLVVGKTGSGKEGERRKRCRADTTMIPPPPPPPLLKADNPLRPHLGIRDGQHQNPLTTGGWMLMDGGKGKEERIVIIMRGALSLQDVGILGGGGGGEVYRVEQERDVGSAAGRSEMVGSRR